MNEKMQPLKTPEQICLAQAMTAKDKIFKAQDALYYFTDDELRRKAKKLLDCARSDLEELDNLLTWGAYQERLSKTGSRCRCLRGKEIASMTEDNWKHRSSGMRCRTCMYFVTKEPEEGPRSKVAGRCRRHCPTVAQGWPVVFEDDWCGDHKLDVNKLDPSEFSVDVPTSDQVEREMPIVVTSDYDGEGKSRSLKGFNVSVSAEYEEK